MGYPRIIARAISGSSQQIESTGVGYHGFTFRNTDAGAVATVKIRNGGATGTILDDVQLSAGESAREYYDPAGGGGMRADLGLYVEIVAGTVEGSVRVG